MSHEAIYQYIYKENPSLIVYLPRQHNKRRKKYTARKTHTVWGSRTSILELPNQINDRSSYEHWESDSIESSDK